MDNKLCPKCGAKWLDGQLYWSTGKPGTEEDLAGLVCDVGDGVSCVNKLRGTNHGGMTWQKRMKVVDEFLVDHDKEQLERRFKL